MKIWIRRIERLTVGTSFKECNMTSRRSLLIGLLSAGGAALIPRAWAADAPRRDDKRKDDKNSKDPKKDPGKDDKKRSDKDRKH